MNKIQTTFYCLLAVIFFFPPTSHSQNCTDPNGDIWVLNTNDEGDDSFREAILCANSSPGANTIRFNIPGSGPHIIYVGEENGAELPALLDETTIIDGTTQPGYTGSPVIVLDGQNNNWNIPINAIWIRADHCEVYGLEIRNFPDDAVDVRDADQVHVGASGKGNYIHDNGSETDFFPGLPGTGPWEGCGIVIREGSGSCLVQGNTISDNEYCGIRIRGGGDDHQIGGDQNGETNVINSNAVGIRISANTNGTRIQQNSLFCNDTLAIALISNANNNISSPEITDALALEISGTAGIGDQIEVFLVEDADCPTSPCQGKVLLGTTPAPDGTWSLPGPFLNGINQLSGGQIVTATATDPAKNTSEFSVCEIVSGVSFCTDPFGDIWVTNTNDVGPGSLRDAIDCANATLGANTIKFNIPGNMKQVIRVGAVSGEPLPALLDEATTIDATTQNGFGLNGNTDPRIVLDGQYHDWTGPINAVWVRGDYCEIYALEIINFPDDGIDVTNADFVKIGDAGKGNVIYKNGYEQDYFPDAPGTGPWNGCGIVMKLGAENCEVKGNIVGTDYLQTDDSGNEYCGIVVQNGGDENIIGGSETGEGNIIAHHTIGIRISNNSFSTTISANSMYCNDSIPILLLGNANMQHPAPVFDSVTTTFISGFADTLDQVEVFISIDSLCEGVPCQGTVYLGTAEVLDSTWVLEAPFENGISLYGGEQITATATDTLGNTSVFTACMESIHLCDLEIIVSNPEHTSCGEDNGAFTVETNGGTPPFTYDIGNGPVNTNEFSNLAGGTYEVIVLDTLNCSNTIQVIINPSSNPEASVSNLEDATCGENNGAFTVVVINGNSPYSFDIGNGPTNNPEFTGLSAGIYSVTVSDADHCEDFLSVTINSVNTLEISINQLMSTTCGLDNGSFVVNASGGTAPYTYDIGNGPNNNPEFTGLAAGTYMVTVTDDDNCEETTTATVGEIPPPIAFIVEQNDASCGGNNGSVTIGVNGGTSPFLFDIGNGPTGNPQFTNLSPGDYAVTVTDEDDCEDSIEVSIGSTNALEADITALMHTSCGNNNGAFTVSVTSGTAPYTYDIGNGPTGNPEFTALGSGTYEVFVEDAENCSVTLTVVINPSTAPSASISQVMDATCGLDNGSFLIEVINGNPPYSFDIGNGPTNNPEFTGLSAGTYSVTVSDADHCEDFLSVTINSVNTLEVSINQLMPTTCGLDNGSFVVNASGGTAPYTYDIGNGPGNDPEFTGLAGGTYTIIVTDDDNCEETTTVTVGEIPPPIAFIVEQNDASCGGNNGSVTIGVNGGTSPFLFDIGNGPTGNPQFTNLSPGDYAVTVTDADDCEDSINVSIGSTNALEADITALMHTSCGNNNGAFTVSVTSGTAPYTYDIGNGPTGNPEFTALGSGTYVVFVEDAENCSVTLTVVINPSTAPSASISQVMDATCGLNNGSFLVGVINGNPPYSFDIGNGPTNNPEFTNLSAGNYTVTITDQDGCIDSESVTINSTGGPQAQIEDVFDSTCDQDNGSFSISANNGTPPYDYDIGNGPTANNDFDNLAAGSYIVTVTDINDCSTTASVDIFETGTPEPFFTNIQNETCEQSNGAFTIDVNGGVAGYLYDIGDGFTGSPNFTGLMAGDYTVTVIDAVGCTATESTTLVNEGINPLANFAYTVDEATVFFTNLSIGAVNYFWDFGDLGVSTDENPIHVFNGSGDYLVCLTIFNDCGEDTFCENVIVDLPLSLVNIFGNIAKENDQTVGSVTVNCTDTGPFETEIDGDYEFLDLPAGEDYLIEPIKDFNSSNGLSAFDIFLISQHILNVEPLDSPYKIIAADADNSGSVSALDLFRIQQVILNNIDTFPNNTSWRFVPAAFNFPDPADPLGFPFPETITLNDLNMDAFNQDFVAIKVGDVNLSSDPAALTDPVDEIRMTLLQTELTDGTMLLEFQSAENQSFVAFETEINLEDYGLNLEQVFAGGILPAFKNSRGEEHLKLLWYHGGSTPNREFRRGEVLFQLKCKKRGFLSNGIKVMQFEKSKVYDPTGQKASIRLETIAPFEPQLVQAIPNPFEASTTIIFNQNKAGTAKINLFSAQGELIYTREHYSLEGLQKIQLKTAAWPSGIYFYELKTGGESFNGKLVKL